MSLIDPTLTKPIHPVFPLRKEDRLAPTDPDPAAVQPNEPAGTRAVIAALQLIPHPEGGYFVETDRDQRRVANPFHASYDSGMTTLGAKHVFSEVTDDSAAGREHGEEGEQKGDAKGALWTALTRSASTNIFYLLTQGRGWGRFHRNKGRTVHTLHKGRARYVIIHADEVYKGIRAKGDARIETYVVGQDVVAGEKLQWIVDGGKYKASFLLADEEGGQESREGCLISETVIPGFEYTDHDFLKPEELVELIGAERAAELDWLLTKCEE
ncbi:hypothetical protein MPH_11415 [Macrophomina phaseolina MS6]|uniref:DUF985 domain-containing protein n=2 Tax=Macrophomina phaseolina TaxID=35725 RepID=K2QNM5_MACPH|nr:hypothetical protein MPH_11415 [Macrophomina phaseolina MS6]KAH7056960.1 RmlC-like cupin domain-containing protein [Macrophomina phaseolina]